MKKLLAPAVLTFLTTNDFSGKTVIPFMTNGGWPGHSSVFMFQRQSNQPVGLICHKQWNIQHIIIKLQVIQRESNTEFDLVREQLLELLKALAGGIGFGFDFKKIL